MKFRLRRLSFRSFTVVVLPFIFERDPHEREAHITCIILDTLLSLKEMFNKCM